MSFVVLNCQVVEWVDIFANAVLKNPGILLNKWKKTTKATVYIISYWSREKTSVCLYDAVVIK